MIVRANDPLAFHVRIYANDIDVTDKTFEARVGDPRKPDCVKCIELDGNRIRLYPGTNEPICVEHHDNVRMVLVDGAPEWAKLMYRAYQMCDIAMRSTDGQEASAPDSPVNS